MDRLKLKAVLGSHPHVQAVKSGELRSNRFDLDFIEYTPTNTAFKPMVREQAFDVCEMAIVTYLMAKAQGKPLVLLPATMLGRFQHSYALYSPAQGTLGPSDLEGKRVGIRSFTTTTGAWIRGILANDYGVNLDKIRWVTFEDPHVAEYVDTTERAPKHKKILQMLLDGELDVVLGEASNDPKLRPLFPDPAAVSGIYDLLKQNKAQAGPAATPDLVPFGIEANRRSLELIVDYAFQQALIPRRYAVEDLFDATTRGLN
jgi:4,5-dihydroxyphthalate decarboxylase